jgi:hypothetical protein
MQSERIRAQAFTRTRRLRWSQMAALGTAALGAYILHLNESLVTADAPAGMYSLLFAWTPESANMILTSWVDDRAVTLGLLAVAVAYVPFYASFLVAIAEYVTNCGNASWKATIIVAVWTGPLAGAIDVVECLGLGAMIIGSNPASFLPIAVSICAVVKFGLIAVAIVSSAALAVIGKTLRRIEA